VQEVVAVGPSNPESPVRENAPCAAGAAAAAGTGATRGAPVARPADELTVARAERDLSLARLHQADADHAKLRADLAEALEQVEYWRTLAEYRERRLVERLG